MNQHSKSILSAVLLGSGLLVSPAAAAESPSDASSAIAAATLSDVVVTARRRTETLQATPIAETALTGATLEARGVTALDGLARVAPSLTITGSSAFSGSSQTPAIFMRGIGQTDFTLNTDPGVGLYVDGVYIARSVGALMDLVDIDRVEVLRGPQGTLFGRNSVGGAISIVTRTPGATFGGRVYAAGGSDNLRLFGGEVDLPIGSDLRTSLSVQSDQQDGYVRRLADGVKLGNKDSQSARLRTLWTPTAALEVDVSADYTRSHEHGAPLVLVAVNPNAAAVAAQNVVAAPKLNPALANVPGGCASPAGAAIGGTACYNSQWITGNMSTTNSTFPTFSNVDIWGAAATVSYKLGPNTTLKSITAYRHLHDSASRDGDGSPLQVNSTEDRINAHQVTEELQWLGQTADGRLDYILGAYVFDEQGVNPNTVDFGFVRFLSGGAVHNSSAAAFGQATYRVTDTLFATAGLRYTEETKRFTPDQRVISATPIPFFPPFLQFTPGERLTTTDQQTTKADELTPRVDLSYRPNSDVLAYLSYSRGFKSGGFTQRIFPALPVPPSFTPETASVYEAGAKLDLFDKRLRVNGAAYLTDYQDLQVTVLVGVAPTVQNAASARIKGGELEITAIPVDRLTFTTAVGYTDAAYTRLDARVSPTITADNRFPGASKWTLNSSLAYVIAIGNAFTLTPRVDWSYRSRYFFDAENLVGQGAYGLVDVGLALADVRGDWTASLFGRNVGDKHYAIHGEQVLDPLGWKLLAPGRGSVWGLKLDKTF